MRGTPALSRASVKPTTPHRALSMNRHQHLNQKPSALASSTSPADSTRRPTRGARPANVPRDPGAPARLDAAPGDSSSVTLTRMRRSDRRLRPVFDQEMSPPEVPARPKPAEITIGRRPISCRIPAPGSPALPPGLPPAPANISICRHFIVGARGFETLMQGISLAHG